MNGGVGLLELVDVKYIRATARLMVQLRDDILDEVEKWGQNYFFFLKD